MESKTRQNIFIFLVFLLVLAGCASREEEAGDAAETRFFGMDTDISITAYGKDAEEALEDARSKVAELERLWSVTDENSDIYAINHSQGKIVSIHRETEQILSFALGMAEQTGGALEPTIYQPLLHGDLRQEGTGFRAGMSLRKFWRMSATGRSMYPEQR